MNFSQSFSSQAAASLSHQPRVGKKSVVLATGVLGDWSQHLFFHFRIGLGLLQESPQLLVTAVGYRGLRSYSATQESCGLGRRFFPAPAPPFVQPP